MANGNAGGLVGYSRRNFMVLIQQFATWDAFNDYLEEQCLKRQADVLRGQSETIGQCLARDLAAMSDLPAVPFDACDQATARVSFQALVRYKTNDYTATALAGDSAGFLVGHGCDSLPAKDGGFDGSGDHTDGPFGARASEGSGEGEGCEGGAAHVGARAGAGRGGPQDRRRDLRHGPAEAAR